jgi:hypothetical protein
MIDVGPGVHLETRGFRGFMVLGGHFETFGWVYRFLE